MRARLHQSVETARHASASSMEPREVDHRRLRGGGSGSRTSRDHQILSADEPLVAGARGAGWFESPRPDVDPPSIVHTLRSACARRPDGAEQALGRQRDVDVLDADVGERVHDRVHQCPRISCDTNSTSWPFRSRFH